jgi:hypothetical protein
MRISQENGGHGLGSLYLEQERTRQVLSDLIFYLVSHSDV